MDLRVIRTENLKQNERKNRVKLIKGKRRRKKRRVEMVTELISRIAVFDILKPVKSECPRYDLNFNTNDAAIKIFRIEDPNMPIPNNDFLINISYSKIFESTPVSFGWIFSGWYRVARPNEGVNAVSYL